MSKKGQRELLSTKVQKSKEITISWSRIEISVGEFILKCCQQPAGKTSSYCDYKDISWRM